ncbi:MAG: exodeoxyribonuclease V subunit gamma, partial [Actinomycetota bacterium]|nr:exodeoxyribonuclease V subunit gamma [Actinomycetota bacterium]
MTLHLHRADRTDRLADGLAQLLVTPLADPFAEEYVVVPAKGVERWLTQRLSHHLGVGPRGGDGVCAGVRFANPRSLVALLTGTELTDPWDPDRMVWPLLKVVDRHLEAPELAMLARHLGTGQTGVEAELRRGRRYSVARRIAGLFASYAVQRPQLLVDWRGGRDTDGSGLALDTDLTWQPHLWRLLIDQLPDEPPDVRHARALGALREGTLVDLPSRLSLFGHTRLPVTEIELLGALGEHREVHLWLPQASPGLWAAIAGPVAVGPVRRREDHSGDLAGPPLLASLGRDSRELERSLLGSGLPLEDDPVVVQYDEPASLLTWLQRDLRANLAPGPEVRAGRVLSPVDRSLQVHACHGAGRQVGVLREVLVGLLQDDPTLEPRDIVVMC